MTPPPTCAPFITYLAPFNALICTEHGHALTLWQLDRHLQRLHRLDLGQRRSVLHHYSRVAARATTHLALDYETLETGNPVEPFAELSSPVPAFACTKCRFLSINLRHTQNHLREEHGVQGQRGRRLLTTVCHWREVEAQTFFQKTSERRWFEVKRPTHLPPPSHADLAPSLKRFMDEAWEESEAHRTAPEQPPVIDANVHRSMTRPWLNKTKWLEHLDGIDPKTILSAASWIQPDMEGAELLRFVARAGEQMLEESLSRLKHTSDLALRHLANFSGSSDGQLDTTPFKAMQESSTHTRYFHAWLRLLFFVLRISQGWLDFGQLDRTLFVLTGEQSAAVREVLRWADLQDLGDQALDGMKDALLTLSMSLLTQRLVGNRFESAILSYAAARGLSDTTGVWLEPGSITSYLYGLIWCSQVVVLGHSFRFVQHNGTDRGLTSVIAEMSRRWLTNTRETPVMYLLTLHLYMRKAAKNTPAPAKILWADGGNKIFYEDLGFTMTELKTFCSSMLTKAEASFVKELLLSPEEDPSFLTDLLPRSQIGMLTDSVSTSSFGYSFLRLPLNNLSRFASFGKDKLRQSRSLSSTFFYSDSTGHHLHSATVQAYHKKVLQFLELLAVLVYITGGAPPRATELVGLRWRNNELRRDIFLHDGLAMLVPVYNKTQAMMDATKTIPRFMPLRLTRLYILFLAAIKPFLEFLQHMESGVQPNVEHSLAGFFLFPSSAGSPFASTKISECLGRESMHLLGRKLSVSVWRHMCKAIVRMHLPSGGKADREGYLSDDSDASGDGALWATQFGHSVRTGAMVYGREVDLGSSMLWENIHHFRRISTEWHTFLGLDKDIGLAPRPPRNLQTPVAPLALPLPV